LNYFYTKIVRAQQPTNQSSKPVNKMHFSIIIAILPLLVNGFVFTSKKNDFHKKQKAYITSLLQTNDIRITDRILYNKDVTYSFLLELCPVLTDGLIDYYSEYHLLKNISKETFEKNMTENVGEIFMESIYNSKNYPSYHTDVTLNIDMNDIIRYHELHCNGEDEYAVNNTYMMNMKKQMVYKHKTQKLREIDINFAPTYENAHYDYNEDLCPFVEKYMSAKKYNTSDTYQIEYDIYEKFIDEIYTPSNYGSLYNPTVSIKQITYKDATIYWKTHCINDDTPTLYTISFYSFLTLISIAGIFCLSVIGVLLLEMIYCNPTTRKYKYCAKNE
jgi:hypothetical protein